ncbi:MAG: hypothetical protein WB683_19645, partial [Candidatus Sulfotelmatobacter sp.]
APGCTSTGQTVAISENPGSNLTINNLVLAAIPIVASEQGSYPTQAAANQALCNSIVQAVNPMTNTSPWVDTTSTPPQTAQCFVYQNAYQNSAGQWMDAPVMLAITCPAAAGGQCDTPSAPFYAAEAAFFSWTCLENSPLIAPGCSPVSSPSSFGDFSELTSTTGYPAIGFLQGAGSDPNNPCSLGTNQPPLFTSNQIVAYTLGDGTSSTPVKAGSPGLTSCFVATYDTPGEIPTVSVTINGSSPSNGVTYQQGAPVTANYACTAVSTDPDSILDPKGYPATGPYLTVNSCTATSGLTAGGGTPTTGSPCAFASSVLDTCSSMIALDTSEVGAHTLTVQVEDSALNTNSATVTYNVVAATNVAIANIAASQTTPGSKLTYIIGVGDLGAANAVNVLVTDTLASGTTFVSASGTNIAFPCTTVGGKTTCKVTSTPISCSASGGIVTCPVGTIMPESLYDLNGAVIEVTVLVNQQGTKKNPTTLSNTAKVTQSNAETKQDNTSTATTTVN